MSRTLDWREEALTRHHNRSEFDCGVSALNEYLRRYARRNHESGGAKTFVTVSPKTPAAVLGYYTISPGAIAFTKTLPVFRLGRLAVSVTVQGQGLGGDLLLSAGERALAVAQEVGGVALAIDAKDDRAANWYERFGALRLLDDPLKLVLPLETIAAALKR